MNKNVILIVFDNNIDNQKLLQDRIRAIDDSYICFDNCGIISTILSPKEVYLRLSRDEFSEAHIACFILDLGFEKYWGMMPTSLWRYLEQNMSFVNYSCEEEVNRLNKELIEMQKQLSESKVEYRRIENDFRNLQGNYRLVYQQKSALEQEVSLLRHDSEK